MEKRIDINTIKIGDQCSLQNKTWQYIGMSEDGRDAMFLSKKGKVHMARVHGGSFYISDMRKA